MPLVHILLCDSVSTMWDDLAQLAVQYPFVGFGRGENARKPADCWATSRARLTSVGISPAALLADVPCRAFRSPVCNPLGGSGWRIECVHTGQPPYQGCTAGLLGGGAWPKTAFPRMDDRAVCREADDSDLRADAHRDTST